MSNDDALPRPVESLGEGQEATVRVADVSEALGTKEALRTWLEEAAATHGARWLLGYDDDGILWGRFDEGRGLITAREAVRQSEGPVAAERFAQLRPITLREVTIFNHKREVVLWRSDVGHWQARYIREPDAEEPDGDGYTLCRYYFDEDHLLLGRYRKRIGEAFMLAWEGRNQRHLQAIPALLSENRNDPANEENTPRLRVRTYLTEGPWHEPGLHRLVSLVDVHGNDLHAPGSRSLSTHS